MGRIPPVGVTPTPDTQWTFAHLRRFAFFLLTFAFCDVAEKFETVGPIVLSASCFPLRGLLIPNPAHLPGSEVCEGLVDFFFGVHDEGAVAGDRFVERHATK